MKKIFLGGKHGSIIGNYALIDNNDFKLVSQFKWTAHRCGNTIYAATKINRKTVEMHRLILGIIDPKIKTDHKDRNGLNNQRYNLRECTHAQNISNMRIRTGGTSGFRGVYKKGDKFIAKIRDRHIGCFKTEIEAALAYNKEAIIEFGKFANLNENISQGL